MDRQLSNDFIVAANQRIIEREYWLKKFSDDFQRGYLPYDFPWSSQRATVRATETCVFPHDLTLSCLRLANASSHNLYLILCSCLALLTSKYLASPDVVIGSPVLKNAATEEYLNTVIPLRLMFQEHMTFKQVLTHVKEVYLEGITHQNYPIEMLAAQVGYHGKNDIFPFFDLVVLLQEIHMKQFFQHIGPNMLITFKHTNTTIEIEADYNTALYEKKTVQRLIQQFTSLLSQVLGQSRDTAIRELDVISQEDSRSLLANAHRTDAAFPEHATLTHVFEETVERFPQQVALQAGNLRLTYAELNSRANRLARVLRTKGSQPDAIIGLYAERSPEMIVGMLAILKAGAAYLPLDPHYPAERIRFMLEDSQTRLICTQSHLADDLPVSHELVLLDDEQQYNGSESNQESLHTPKNLAYIIYTSGTTGKPKGVLVEHQQVVRLLKNAAFPFHFDENDTWTLFHSFCFDFSVWEIYGALLYGGRLLVVPQEMTLDPSHYLQLLKKERVTVLNQTPSAFFRLIEEERRSDAHTLALRYVIFGGEALQPGRLGVWSQLYPTTTLINMYGITETTVHVTYKEITRREIQADISTIGLPIPTTSVYILDAQLRPVPIGMPGEIFVGGKGVARGYLNRPDLTQERFLPNPFRLGDRLYRTGDIGRWRNNGEIEYIGRSDQQVKIRGFRIEIGEIEAQILKFPGIINTAVVSVEDGQGELSLCAYIVSDSSAYTDMLPFHLKEHLERLLPAHMLPAYIVPLDKLPLTEQGKLNRTALPDPRQFSTRETLYAAPRTQLEWQVVRVWAEVLQIPEDTIGIHDRFFDVGGNSFTALLLNNRLQEVLQQQISVISHFQYPTILSFVEYLTHTHENADRPEASDEEAEPMDAYSMMAGFSQLAEETLGA